MTVRWHWKDLGDRRYVLSSDEWPTWWDWDLELSPHVLKRMEDRQFNEVDLRTMLDHASGYRPSTVQGRSVIETRHSGRRWEVIVEPDADLGRLVVVTAFPVWDE